MFCCEECGAHAPRWEGRCSRCGAWGSLEVVAQDDSQHASRRGRGPRGHGPHVVPEPVDLASLNIDDESRIGTGYVELDRVLGGGMVGGTVILVGGEPGIGKSTLLLGVAAKAREKGLYVAGEESPAQIARRAARLGLRDCGLRVVGCTDTDEIAACIDAHRPVLCVIDSVQTLHTRDVAGGPGGPAQVRAAAESLVPVARRTGTVFFLVGQVTKVGGLAGPRMLEHAVDVVLLFEGDRHTAFRVLRGVKNRHGPTDEIGLFEMRDSGLHQVRNASQRLLAERGEPGPGSLVGIAVEGRRALCLEVQSLIVGDKLTAPRRRGQGVDPRRLELLIGVVESLFAPEVQQREVFVNVVGGLSTRDPGLDLAIAAAVLSAQRGDAVPHNVVAFGEVGLRGEVRSVPHTVARLKEARAMGFTHAVVPADTKPIEGMRLRPIRRVHELFHDDRPWVIRPEQTRPGDGQVRAKEVQVRADDEGARAMRRDCEATRESGGTTRSATPATHPARLPP